MVMISDLDSLLPKATSISNLILAIGAITVSMVPILNFNSYSKIPVENDLIYPCTKQHVHQLLSYFAFDTNLEEG